MTDFTRRRAIIGGGAFAFAALAASPAFAHRLARTETELRFGEDGAVSVIHTYHVQDIQDALFAAGVIDRPDVGSLRNRAKAALYTAEHFAVHVNEVPVELTIVGAEVIGSSLFVYQEGVEAFPGTLWVAASMLRPLITGQRNSVNVVMSGKTRTLEFSGDDAIKVLE